jgi:diacylglycerol kinase (ATP)
MTRYAVLHGPRSGRGHAAARGAFVVDRLRAAGQQVHELQAASVEEAREACRVAVAEGVEVLAVVGGDGLVGLAAGACAGTGTALGIVPSGTGNDGARSLGVPLDTAGAVAALLGSDRRRIDLIRVDPVGRIVLGSVPAGLDARIAARAAALPKWLGPAVYAVATVPEIPRLRTMDYELELDGETWRTRAHVVAVCNTDHYGGGMLIAPGADPTDGLLDVVVITQASARQAVGLLAGVFRGRHIGHPSVHLRRARCVTVRGPELIAHGDGEAVAPLPVTCTVLPGAVEVVVPAG